MSRSICEGLYEQLLIFKQEELQRAERQLDQEKLRPPTAAPGQLAEHEAAWQSTLQDAQQKLQQALTKKSVSCCTSAILENLSSSGKARRVLFITCLRHHATRLVTRTIDGA